MGSLPLVILRKSSNVNTRLIEGMHTLLSRVITIYTLSISCYGLVSLTSSAFLLLASMMISLYCSPIPSSWLCLSYCPSSDAMPFK